ncbi:MAG: hypothetical protein COB83_03020 [Gammaproteobacteria bacterium]|nr:MAG: hypothetical protein COB83_03020 [Gammaproteobacteria bacterium]
MKHVIIITLLIAVVFMFGRQTEVQQAWSDFNFTNSWQTFSSPGELSQAHQFLKDDCESCHQPVQGVDDKQCIMCHANANTVLIRQPTAFHADVQECSTCHREHQGINASMTTMDHNLLVTLAQVLPKNRVKPNNSDRLLANTLSELTAHNKIHAKTNPLLSDDEALLNCASCHSNDDRHFTLFGKECGDCHSTNQWSLPDYRHPSSRSKDCAQCHQAPPSHYKPHYKMMSQKIAGKPKAAVEACYQCHQSTSWNDIQQLGLYKHH